MRKAIWTAVLVIAPALCCGAGASERKQADKTEQPAQAREDQKQTSQAQSLSPVVPVPGTSQAAGEGKADPSKTSSAAGTLKRVGGVPVDKTYVIGAQDQIGVNVWGVAPLSNPYLVRPDGKITMPLIGDITAAGLTPEQLQVSIADRLKQKYINSPDVTVVVLAVNSKKYYIHGEVNDPGAYPLIVPTTVLEALASAHGFKDFANVKKIRIMRGPQQFRFNYKDVTRGKHPEENIYLQPGDEIIVP